MTGYGRDMSAKLISIFTVAGVVAAGSSAFAINSQALKKHSVERVVVTTDELNRDALLPSSKKIAPGLDSGGNSDTGLPPVEGSQGSTNSDESNVNPMDSSADTSDPNPDNPNPAAPTETAAPSLPTVPPDYKPSKDDEDDDKYENHDSEDEHDDEDEDWEDDD